MFAHLRQQSSPPHWVSCGLPYFYLSLSLPLSSIINLIVSSELFVCSDSAAALPLHYLFCQPTLSLSLSPRQGCGECVYFKRHDESRQHIRADASCLTQRLRVTFVLLIPNPLRGAALLQYMIIAVRLKHFRTSRHVAKLIFFGEYCWALVHLITLTLKML